MNPFASELIHVEPYVQAVISAVAMVVAFIFVWSFLRRRLALALLHLSRRATLALVVSYAVTWTLGARMSHTNLAAAEIARYKRLKAQSDGRVRDVHLELIDENCC